METNQPQVDLTKKTYEDFKNELNVNYATKVSERVFMINEFVENVKKNKAFTLGNTSQDSDLGKYYETRKIINLLVKLTSPPRRLECLQKIFYNQYIKMDTVPDVDKILQLIKSEAFQNVNFLSLIKDKNVVYHPVPKINSYILYEHPDRVFERHVYLKRMLQYRAQKREFTYISWNLRWVSIAVPERGTFEMKKIDASDLLKLKNMIYDFEKNTVIVLYSEICEQDDVNEYSDKKTMETWLKQRHININSKNHTAEFYKLIQLYKKNNPSESPLENMLKSHGFEVIVVPYGYSKLNLIDKLTKLNKIDTKSKKIINDLGKLLQDLNAELGKVEKEILHQDLELEDFLEVLLEKIRSDDISPSEIQNVKNPEYEYTAHVCKIVRP